MTQFYKMPGFTLANANFSTKVLLSLFQISIGLGVWVAVLQSLDRVGGSNDSAVEWVLGNELDFEATEIKVEKSYREMLAITHEVMRAIGNLSLHKGSSEKFIDNRVT